MKKLVTILSICLLSTTYGFAQNTPEAIKALCLRVIDFDESKIDSMRIYANQIEKEAKKINYTEGVCYSYRLRGIASEMEGKYQDASRFYLSGLKFAEDKKDEIAKLLMLSDLGSLNVSLKQYEKAKRYFQQALVIAQNEKPQPKPKRLSSFYQNLGICYRNLKQIDSALYSYDKAMTIKKQIGDSAGIANVGTNLSTLLTIHKKDYQAAKKLLDFNISYHAKIGAEDDLWGDYINLIGMYIPLKEYGKAKKYLDESLRIAQKINSPAKIVETYEAYAEYYSSISDYKNAFEYYQKFHALDKEMLNSETQNAVLELEKKYETEKKTTENKLLNTQLDAQKKQSLLWLIVSSAVTLLAATVLYSWYKNRQKNKVLTEKNDFIELQNKKLAELNQEKNHLISVVSHDLGSPFSTIKLWSGILNRNKNLDADAHEAIDNINRMAEQGQQMVKQILQVEKAETNRHSIQFSKMDLVTYTKDLMDDFKPVFDNKEISVDFSSNAPTAYILSDKHYLNRILENIISNAIKYSYRGGNVRIRVESNPADIKISVKDNGVGMDAESQRNLFSKYGQTSAQPTENESSTGLGLHIVKRLLDELGGTITCQSELGKGSEFTVILKK